MPIVTSFEVLAQPIVPGVPNVPYVQQGSFIQLTNLAPESTPAIEVVVSYFPSPAFVASSGSVSLTANYIDATGAVTMLDTATFLRPPVGFTAVFIPGQGTFIFGVQYIVNPSAAAAVKVGSTPQDGAGTRGVVSVSCPASGAQLAALASIRQVFNNYQPNGDLLDVSEGAYSAPIIGGPVITF